LIGFAFSGAASRFIDRQDIIVREANALGTAYLRADTIAEPQRGNLKAALKEYTADRVTMLSREGRDQIEPLLAKVSNLHKRMWRSAIKGTQDNAPLMAVILPPINEVIDLHSTHLAMARRHLPIPIMASCGRCKCDTTLRMTPPMTADFQYWHFPELWRCPT
jgi:hypothetical protein